jgi:hypothetical protein
MQTDQSESPAVTLAPIDIEVHTQAATTHFQQQLTHLVEHRDAAAGTVERLEAEAAAA